ncbi:MAG: hypothetical protein FWF15_12270, partial [Oscillospiraceae bacterium]|nr:hypothetical protein [Oscillospiraceae bacterium]
FLYLLPRMWLIILPGNFIIDSLVLIIAMVVMRIESKRKFYKSVILKVFCFGLLADLIGVGFMFLLIYLGTRDDEILLTLLGFIAASVCIFVFNYYISFRKYEKKIKFGMAIVFAIVTAPYTFFIPMEWLHSF